MENCELISFATDVELARFAANEWLTLAEAAACQDRRQFVALSGGRIAGRFFSASVELARERVISLRHVHFFWADERCVPPQDPESNFALADRLLFQPMKMPPGNIHRIAGEQNPESAAANAGSELSRIVPKNQARQPQLDIIFLGMGEDGHVASLFPSAPREQTDSREHYHAVIASKPPPQRITLGFAALSAAAQVWVLASGAGKERALASSLRNGDTPLGKVLKSRQHTRIFTDIRPA